MLNVTSEVGRLRRVLVHEPGAEVDQMVPAMMEELLFDDILFGDGAREEHGRFRRVMQLLGIEVLDAGDLLVDSLEFPEARQWVLDHLSHDLPAALRERIAQSGAEDVASILVSGVRLENPLPGMDVEDLFEMPPLPNWCFQRDPQVVLGNGVVFSAMATAARWRESLLSQVIFRFHPELRSTPIRFDPLDAEAPHPEALGLHRPRFEGGDLLVLSRDVVAVGISERTTRAGLQQLIRCLAGNEDGPRWLVTVDLPNRRAFMHLDTLMTPIDRDACLVYAPVILPGGTETARVSTIDLHAGEPVPRPGDDLLSTLATLGVDFEPIFCGGTDPVVQQREQWTDGANALAVAPGIILLYDRNLGTADELERHGFNVVRAEDLLLGREEIYIEDAERVCILLSSHEISRARGGPHCLSHPLVRDDL